MVMIMNGDDTDDGGVHTVFTVFYYSRSVKPQGGKEGHPSSLPGCPSALASQQMTRCSDLHQGV